MNPVDVVARDSAGYPATLRRYLGEAAPDRLTVIGNRALLTVNATALFCSVKCPGDLILKTYDLAREWRDAGVPVISGFHSPMERECLRILLKGDQPVIICPARSIESMRLPSEWRRSLEAGRLLLMSPFDARCRRATADTVWTRSHLVAAFASRIFVAFAEAGGKTDLLCGKIAHWEKPLLTFHHSKTVSLVELGAKTVDVSGLFGSYLANDSTG